MDEGSIGVFDSGVGGLGVLRQIRARLPHEPLLYLADQAHVPYGSRSLEQVRTLSQGITDFLLRSGAKLVVVACNTASAAALHQLRRDHPSIPIVGMEPAVKPAAETTRSRVVAVLATPTTFQGRLFESVVERFASDVTVIEQTLPDLVTRIEAGDLDGPQTRAILKHALPPLLERGVDTLVLACTHYSFILPLLKEMAGPRIRIIDPSPAIARQTQRRLQETGSQAPTKEHAAITYFTSGEVGPFRASIERLVGLPGETKGIRWKGTRLFLETEVRGARR